MNNSVKVIVVLGPTASGKSDFAVEYALKNNGEIISADSRQLYKGLDIGTGKITPEETKGIKHHMLSVYELEDEVSVTRFAQDAQITLAEIISRHKTPIICGGTGQYIDALIFDTQIPLVSPNKKLREVLVNKSTSELFQELNLKDPNRAKTIDKHNRPRLIRALEIIDTLGSVPSQETTKLIYDTHFYLLSPTRELLRKRITKRLEKRLAEGMLEEVALIMQKGYTSQTMKKFGLEYVTLGKYLENSLSLEGMKTEIINKSMQYAKRQQTWNKKYLRDYKKIVTEIEVKE